MFQFDCYTWNSWEQIHGMQSPRRTWRSHRNASNSLWRNQHYNLSRDLLVRILSICGTYIVHHFNGTGLRCAPLTCIVHHRPELCTIVHTGDPLFEKLGSPPKFVIFGGSHGTFWKRTLFVIEWTSNYSELLQFSSWVHCKHTQVVHKGPTHIVYSISVIHNIHTNQGSQCGSVPTYTWVVHNVALYWLGGAHNVFFMYVISYHRDDAQCDVVSLDE